MKCFAMLQVAGLTFFALMLSAGCTRTNASQSELNQGQTNASDDGAKVGRAIEPAKRTRSQWRAQLTAEQFRILRDSGTERAFHNQYYDNKRPGLYRCAGCGQVLFSSKDKFHSGTGWPSFTKPVSEGQVGKKKDTSAFMVRTEVLCSRCGGHLGHVFHDGPPPTGLRYCVNSAALKFIPQPNANQPRQTARSNQ